MTDSAQTRTATARFVATHSVLTLDARHPYAAKSLVDAQDMHRTVMSGFKGWVDDGSRDPRAQMGILSTWTVDLKNAALVLVVQSRVPGDWSHIPKRALRDEPHLITVDRTFRAGESIGFRTVVNPTYVKPQSGPDGRMRRGKRVAHTTPAGVRKWVVRHLGGGTEPSRFGVTTDAEAIAARLLPAVSSPAPHKGLKIARAELRGTLTVVDPTAFVTALSDGIGHARAYSCGLVLTR
ncbi:type I-E CRISPR-associated protein Cas6/Cse3/CasE [Streptomyces sp. CA-181903]|uniref:type I-E CRISPR-associated protein Cas6/Cse3/CasE n=1 Tax=Streptomyces sp. CA-181903 TaxID=3240055 RepID=UPI003D8A93AB